MAKKIKIKFPKLIKIELIAGLILAIFLLICHLAYTILYGGSTASKTEETKVEECNNRRILDGICLDNGLAEKYPVAVMIDNHPDSWPQFGLSRAQIVYNTLVEGGQTRLMAVYAGGLAERIGPIRSARPYYLGWAKELDAFYGHSGGSPEAINIIKKNNVKNLEEATSFGPLYFWRDKKFAGPHNLFTSTKNLEQASVDFNLATTTPIIESWQFSENSFTSATETTTRVAITYSTLGIFDVSYKYSTSTNNYLRFQNSAPFIDALDNKQIEIKNLIIQFVPAEIHLDAEDRLRLNTLGTGSAFILFNGQIIRGTWRKIDFNSRTKFFDAAGGEIIFPPGNIWVEVVPGSREVMVE
ncbi:MAG: DUF3048 domain-containing protein [Patescibacteria group bacterium]|nr:DUF3048 domain-containing protein [Patescibacteria group bacterium]